jgi:methionine-rich copper-binding protein CopC
MTIRTNVFFLAAVAVVALVSLVYPVAAHAHADLVEAEPAASTTVDELTRVLLRFDGPVVSEASHLWLQDDSGVVPLSAAHLDGDRTVLVAAVPPLASATYVLGYHVTAVDGDALTGEVPFTLDAPAVGDAPVDPIAQAPTGVALPDVESPAVAAPRPANRVPVLVAVAGVALLTGLALGVIRPLRHKELPSCTS